MDKIAKDNSLLNYVQNNLSGGYVGGRLSDTYGKIGLEYSTIDAVKAKMISILENQGDQEYSIPALNELIAKAAEQMMRETYVKAYGKEYDSPTRRQSPLPLGLAYSVALNKLNGEDFSKRKEIPQEDMDRIRKFIFKDGSAFVVKFEEQDGKKYPVLKYITQQDSTLSILRQEKSLAELALETAEAQHTAFDECLAMLVKAKVFQHIYEDGGTVPVPMPIDEKSENIDNMKMEKGGMIQHGFNSGDFIIEIYKGFGIVENKNNDVIEVINPNSGTRHIVDLDDSKIGDKRVSLGMNKETQIEAAHKYINHLTGDLTDDRFNFMTEHDKALEGTKYTERVKFNMGGELYSKGAELPTIASITIPEELSKYNLKWDWDESDTYVSTMCKNVEIAKDVKDVLAKHGINAHLIASDKRIVVIYTKANGWIDTIIVPETKSKVPNPSDPKNYITIDIRSAAGMKKAEKYHKSEKWKMISSSPFSIKFQKIALEKGGHIGFEKLENKVAKSYEGKPVPKKYQSKYGKTYSKAESKEVGAKVAGKVKAIKTRGAKKSAASSVLKKYKS